MKNRPTTLYAMPELHGAIGRALVASGFWLRIGFVGASAVAVGMIQLFGNEASPFAALGLAAGGAALAVFSWQRAHAALELADGPVAATTVTLESSGGRTVASA